jgi:uncharacterized protein Yka (UPF0111/DUF47 family)
MASNVGPAVEQVGDTFLFLPELINRALAANDRLRYYLTLLEAAKAHAQAPNRPASNLRSEREASGIHDSEFDHVVPSSRVVADNIIQVPGVASILERIVADLREMLQPLRVEALARAAMRERFEMYRRRLEEQFAHVPSCHDDQLPSNAIDALTRHSGNGHDTVYQLAMDLRWELTRLEASVSLESIDGARAYGLTDADRVLVRAFTKGVTTTAALKFDHPGLSTTAMRDGDRLSIQNDLGMTNTHVIVVHVTGLTATLIYTDIHRPRIRFLHDLLQTYNVRWEAASTPAAAENDRRETSIGRYTADSQSTLAVYLTFLGSRLVFLIDWNRARKRLTRFVKNSDAVALLKWAADNNVGHRAFLQAGDIRLIHTAIERATPGRTPYGARLDDLLGRDNARKFLMSVLGIVSGGLLGRRSPRLIEDEIEAELLTYVHTTDRGVIGAATEHATIIVSLAERLLGALAQLKNGVTREDAIRAAELASTWEIRADEIVRHASRLFDHGGNSGHLMRLLSEADEAADALEETAFLVKLIPEQIDSKAVSLLEDLADMASRGAREYVRCLEDARDVARTCARSDVERLLVAVDRLTELEHDSDAAERAVIERLVQGPGGFRELHVLSEMAHCLEKAADSLARCGVIVRDHVLSITAGGG